MCIIVHEVNYVMQSDDYYIVELLCAEMLFMDKSAICLQFVYNMNIMCKMSKKRFGDVQKENQQMHCRTNACVTNVK